MLCLGYCLLEITIPCFVLATAYWRLQCHALSWLLPSGGYSTMLCLGYCLLKVTVPCFVLATAFWRLQYHALSWLLPSGDYSTMLCLGYCLLEVTVPCFVLATAFWRLQYHALSWLLPSGDYSAMLCLGYCLLEATNGGIVLYWETVLRRWLNTMICRSLESGVCKLTEQTSPWSIRLWVWWVWSTPRRSSCNSCGYRKFGQLFLRILRHYSVFKFS